MNYNNDNPTTATRRGTFYRTTDEAGELFIYQPEDQLEELRRTRDAGLTQDLKALWFEVLRARGEQWR